MATPITGAISMADARTELGLTGAISFNDTLYRQLTNQLSGTATLGDARAAASINSSVNNLNVFSTLFASNATATAYKVLVRSGVNVGATAGNTALTLGQFPTGSTIVVNNYGSVLAYGGAGGSYYNTGSSGGDAIYASYANQTVTINNQTGALIYGGGGGGGSGGPGGTGGTGGGGYYSTIQYRYDGGNKWQTSFFSGGYSSGYWDGANVFNQPIASGIDTTYYAGYYRGSTVGQDSESRVSQIGFPVNTYTSGGGGGGGGAGGAGGRGQGADGANAAGVGGSSGAGGSAGGTNAGAGGTGGTGGTGATGGTYGNAGGTGNNGATGNTGASGNNGGGSAGSGGGAGRTGGAAGRYLVKGANSVTLNNSGTVAGGLA